MEELFSRRIFLAAAAGGLAAARSSRAQEPAAGSDAKFSTDVKVVNVLATVRDKQGRIVNSLGKDDFELQDENRPQVIRYFTHQTDLPLTLGLLIDTSLSQRRVLGDEKDASSRFVDKVVREDRDQTFLIRFDRDTELLQDLTSSRVKLENAINNQVQLAENDRSQAGNSGGGGYPGGGYPGGGGGYPGGGYPGGGGGYPGGGRRGGYGGGGGGTTLYDAVYLASNELMKKRMGRKAVIVLSDGVDHGSKVSLAQSIEAAQRADTLVYSIWFTDEEQQQSPFGRGGFGGYGRRRGGGFPQQEYRPDGKKILQQMSRETGAGFFEGSKKLTIDQIYARIEEELRNQYSIGFSPDSTGTLGFHRITLKVKQKDMAVQTREGYYAN